MFENLKNVIYLPLIDSVKKEYTGKILSHLIITELRSLSSQTEYTAEEIESAYEYLELWIQILLKYELNFNIRHIRNLSVTKITLKEALNFENIPDNDPDTEAMIDSPGRTVFFRMFPYDFVKRIFEDDTDTQEPDKSPEPLTKIKKLTVKQIVDALDEAVIGQNEAKKAVAVGILKHIQRLEHPELELDKSNILLIGPTGVGKTEIVRTVSKLMCVPYVVEDASAFTPHGYHGRDVEEIMTDLLKAANGNAALAEHGIVFLDEFDKICCYDGDDWLYAFLKATQSTLLKLIEDGIFEIEINSGIRIKAKGRKCTMSTKNILFIASGAFPGLTEYRKPKTSVGFSETKKIGENNSKATHKDLVHFGMMREIAGRFSTMAELNPLSVDDLYRISVSSKNSTLKQYERLFGSMGLQIDVSDEKIRELCSEAYNEHIGARGLKTVFDKYFEDALYNLLLEAEDTVDKTDEEDKENA